MLWKSWFVRFNICEKRDLTEELSAGSVKHVYSLSHVQNPLSFVLL